MYNPMALDDKRIVVTGASSGIGRSCAEIIALLGGQVILVARNRDKLQETTDLLVGEGHILAPCDLSEIEAIPKWLKTLATTHGPFDGLVHSAGIASTRPLKTMSFSEYSMLMRVNLDAAYALAKGFRQRGVHGAESSLVFISSIAGISGQPGLTAYSASKAGLLGLARSLALELARDGIRVNSVTPGLVETAMIKQMQKSLTPEQLSEMIDSYPLGLGQPEDVGNAVAYMLGKTGRWITGSNLVIDGGITAG